MTFWYHTFHEEMHDLVAGTVGGVSGLLFGHPFDLFKVRLQSGVQNGPLTSVIRQILQKEGVLSLWKGVGPPILANAPINALGFAAYGQAQRFLTVKMDGNNSRSNIPLTPLQTQMSFYTGELIKEYGLPGAFLEALREGAGSNSRNNNHDNNNNSINNINNNYYTNNITNTNNNNNTIPLTTISSVAQNGNSSAPNYLAVFLAGCWSGLISCLISTPSDLIKIQEQKVIGSTSPWTIAKGIIKRSGFGALYQGFWVTVWRDSPSVGLYFLVYEYIKWLNRKETWTPQVLVDGKVVGMEESRRIFEEDQNERNNSTNEEKKVHHDKNNFHTDKNDNPKKRRIQINWEHNIDYSFWTPLIAGAFSGPISWLSTYPLDVVKTTLQSMPQDEFKKTSILKCMKTIAKDKGLGFFLTGLGPTMISAVPVTAITFLCYEKTLGMCKQARLWMPQEESGGKERDVV